MSAPQMSSRSAAKSAPPVHGSDAAPIVYTDGATCCGTVDGVIQLELAANCLIPHEDETKPPRRRTLMTAHVRCSLGAAKRIRDALDKAIALIERPAARAKPAAKPAPTAAHGMPEIERHEMTRAPAPNGQ
jgi:hypothetical protein